MRQFKVLRKGISQKVGEAWQSPKIGDVIPLSEAAAAHLLSEKPPFVEDAEKAEARPPKMLVRPFRAKEENE